MMPDCIDNNLGRKLVAPSTGTAFQGEAVLARMQLRRQRLLADYRDNDSSLGFGPPMQ